MHTEDIADRLAITECLHRYARAIDTREFDALRDVFTADAVIHYDIDQGTKLPLDEMIPWLESALQIFTATHHVITNPIIKLDSDRAATTCYLTGTHVQQDEHGNDVITIEGGTYSDAFVRTESGWRIQHRVLRRVYVNGTYLLPENA